MESNPVSSDLPRNGAPAFRGEEQSYNRRQTPRKTGRGEKPLTGAGHPWGAPFAQSALTAILPLFLGYDHGHWLAPSQHQAVMSPPGPPSQDTTDQATHQTCFASWSRRQEVPDPGAGRAGSPEASLLGGLMAISPRDRTRSPSVRVPFLIALL